LVRPRAVGWASVRAPIYVSSWAVRVSQGNREVERLARKFGFVNLGPIFPDGQYFHLRHRGVVQQSLTPHWGHRLHLKKDPKVQWFQQQTLRRRVKRSVVVPTDPWFSKQWYMNSEAQPDLSVLQAWGQGLSGQGIVVSVLDDGIEKDHPDLWANYDPLASYDFNDYDPDPQPRYTPSDENRHGTRCAGEVAAAGGSSPLDPPSPILPLIYIRKNVSACAGRHNSIRSLEHVQAQLTLSYSRRGDLEISLTSPMGTRSTLVAIRPLDVSTEGYNNWVFMSTHFWDENPQGVWTLGLENKGYYFNTGMLYRYTLLLYGTAEDMTARPTGPQVTSSACVQRDTEGLCQVCDGPAYILGRLCLAYCPPRFFNHTRLVTARPGHTAALALRVCSSCHSSCYTCRGGSLKDCTSCPPSSTLDQQQGSCVGPTTPDSSPRLRAAACPQHRCPASAMVLGLLAMTLQGPVLCSMSMDLPP
ncbi:PREDICTED: proprotein convertase subtilisin/kexin type 4, partial [Mandrillus leucophaeus]|uniref:proprotein convertase subtilisin/kexin type 4 n=1 Tax=Mandrillus leucophaeus TaxID=9568 RepID=UPI0005F3CBC5